MNAVRFLLLALFAFVVASSAATAKDEPQGVSTTDLAKFRVEVGKKLGPINTPLLRLLADFENGKGPQGNELTEALNKEFENRATKYGNAILDFSKRINDVLGRTVHEGDVKANFVKASESCPVVVDLVTKITNTLPWASTLHDKDDTFLKAVQLFGYITSHSLTDYGCRKYFNLVDYIASVDRAKQRFIDSIKPETSDVAKDTVELWNELRDSLVTYITSVEHQLGGNSSVSLDGLNNPEDEAASVAMMQAAAMGDVLEKPAELSEDEVKLRDRVAKALTSKASAVKDEL